MITRLRFDFFSILAFLLTILQTTNNEKEIFFRHTMIVQEENELPRRKQRGIQGKIRPKWRGIRPKIIPTLRFRDNSQ
jgi:hypothetical protein